ncbi:hypothetical protein CQW23_25586 [Capsicum baccatum]|uniref:KIB1-4 beta-propeller domain-containing protein n=1 Tax=Capsicum baccatum TaxID=33114 RepID=A0A2G2VLD2_CAPBA|nr:hypothetical protein CQW23_25586 [Capsicum baccatum]
MDTELTLRDWTKLPNLVLYLILKKIVSISDFLRFSAVCKPWFSYVSKNQAELKQRINSSSIEEMPVLMILGTNQYGSTINTSLYSMTKRKIILELSFPNDDERCCGSSHGWLVFQRSDDIIYLFNPFYGETIHLPSLSYHVDKVVLSKNPSTNPCDVEVVAVVQCGFVPLGLAILRPGSNEWIVMTHGMSRHVVCDVIYYDDRYYVVTSHGRVLSIDKMTLDLKEISGPAPVSSMSVTASKFSGCIANSVYYTGGPLEMFVLSRRSFGNSLFTSPLSGYSIYIKRLDKTSGFDTLLDFEKNWLRFSAVCKPWFSFVSRNHGILKQRIHSSSMEEMPMLMICSPDKYGPTTNTSLYSVTKRKIILELPFPRVGRCCGSSHGWLVFQRFDCFIYLFNPFSGETIDLPSLSYIVDKVVLSKNPSTNMYDVEVIAVVMGVPLGLAILRPGSNEWIVMTHHPGGLSRHHVRDVIYYDDRY